jgi:hypothetical protein
MVIGIIVISVFALQFLLQIPFKIYFLDILNENKIDASFWDFYWLYDIFRDFILTCDKDFETKKKYFKHYTRVVCIRWIGYFCWTIFMITPIIIILL